MLLLAQAAPAADLDLSALGHLALKLAQNGQWAALAVLCFVLLVFVVRLVLAKGLAQWLPWEPVRRALAWLGTDRGGAVLTVATGAATVLCGALVAGAAVTPGLLLTALVTACAGAGGWALLKKTVAPSDKKAAAAEDERLRLEVLVTEQRAEIMRLERNAERTVREQLNELGGDGR